MSFPESGPYYTHLGVGVSLADIRRQFEARTGFKGKQIRILKAKHVPHEGKSSNGCPIAKYIIRRSSLEEKLLVLVKQRLEHTCPTACIVVFIAAWEGVPAPTADRVYDVLCQKMGNYGKATDRRCSTNAKKTCACQGDKNGGASFSFGCSWSHFFTVCKFCKYGDDKEVRKFKLSKVEGVDMEKEVSVEFLYDINRCNQSRPLNYRKRSWKRSSRAWPRTSPPCTSR